MASQEEIRAEGFFLPSDDDGIYKGASIFRENADAAYTWALKVAKREAGEAKKAATFPKELNDLPNTDLNIVYTPGSYFLPAPFPTGYTGHPTEVTQPGILNVFSAPDGGIWGFQEFTQYGLTPRRWWRISRSWKGEWNPWQEIKSTDSHLDTLPTKNIDQLYRTGSFMLPSPYPSSYTGLPEGTKGAGLIHVIGNASETWARQDLVQYGATPRRWWRVSKDTRGGWNPWEEIKAGGGGAGIENANFLATNASHQLREQVFKDAYPLTRTGGKGAVVFRYDHGLTNVKNTLLPIHRKYNLPLYIAMNSRLWDDPQNSGATQEDVKGWITNDRVEIGNHTADHKDKNTVDGMYDAVVNGRKELEQQLGIVVHGFTVPGVNEFNWFEGFRGGSLDSYSDTYMGGLILANHAVCSGNITDKYRPLDGVIRQGSNHYTIEKWSFEKVKAVIDSAANQKRAVTLMVHPNYMGLEGYYTSELIDQVCAYIRARIDAGELADISYYQSHHATL